MQKRGRNQKRINWTKIKLEYMTSDQNVATVLKKYKVSSGKNATKHTKGWIKEKVKLNQRVLEKVKSKVVNTEVKQWDNQIKLWKAVESQAAMLLSEKMKVKETFDPRELDNLASAIQKALQSQRLIMGESTENIERKNVHLDVVELIREIENDRTNRG